MLTVTRNAEGQIQAVAEWVPCDDHKIPSNYGTWIWINQLESSVGAGVHAIQEIILKIANQMPNAVGAYWRREDSTGLTIHQYTRAQLLQVAAQQQLEEVRV